MANQGDKTTVHALLLPAVIHDVRTACDENVAELDRREPGRHSIAASDRFDLVTCPICRAYYGKDPPLDLSGAPKVAALGMDGEAISISVAHAITADMGLALGAFLDELGATNYVEMTVNNYVVTVRRAEGKTPDMLKKEAEAEVERLRTLINRDRTGLAAGLDEVRRIAQGYDWICEGRGPYRYDDDRYRMEVGSLISKVVEAAGRALRDSGSRVDEAFHPRAQATTEALAADSPEGE